MASHDKKGMIDRKEDETTEERKHTGSGRIDHPPKKTVNYPIYRFSLSVYEYSMLVCNRYKINVSHKI